MRGLFSALLLVALLSGCALVSGLSSVTTCDRDPCGSDGGDGSVQSDSATCAMSCTGALPADWTPVTSGTSCKPGLTTATLFTGALGAACPCTCAVKTLPPCTLGVTVPGFYGSSSCTTPVSYASSGCQMGFAVVHAYERAEGPEQNGAACLPDTTPSNAVMKSTLTVCTAPPSCSGAICGAGRVCGMHAGDVACPTGYPKKQLGGSDVNVTCACGACSATGSCAPVLHWYEDGACTKETQKLIADGICHPATPSQAAAYQFTTTPAAICGPSAAGSPMTSFTGPSTICCP